MVAHKRSSFGLQAALGKLITFHNNNQVLIKELLLLAMVVHHIRHLCRHRSKFLLKLVENMCIIKNRVQKKKLKQIFWKIYKFSIWTVICIINYAWIISDYVHPINVKWCAHYYQTTGTESFILIAFKKLPILGPKALWGVHLPPPPPPSFLLGRSRVKEEMQPNVIPKIFLADFWKPQVPSLRAHCAVFSTSR